MKTLIKFIIAIAVAFGLPVEAAAQINAEQVMRVGQNALYFEDYMLSIRYFNQAIEAKPYLARPYFLRAVAKINLEDYTGAEADATEAIDRNPFLPDAYEVRGVARQNLGKLRGAIDDYNHALDLLPKNRGILFNKALAQEEINSLDSAAMTFNELLRQYPNYENGYVGRARVHLEHGDTVAARLDIDKALSISKNITSAYLLRSDLAMKEAQKQAAANGGRYLPPATMEGSDTVRVPLQDALDDITEAIRLQPRESGLYVNRAFMRYNLDDYFGAMADYDYAIQLDPMSAAAIFNRGILRMEVKDNDHAIEDFTRVMELEPDDYRALYNRALLYNEKRMTREALADIDRLVEALPDLPEALYMRSEVQRKAGNMAAAERDYNRALAMSKNLKPKDPPKESSFPTSARQQNVARETGNTDEADANTSLTAEAVARKFTQLRTIENRVDVERDYNNKNIRGKVQDRSSRIELEPLFALSYYASTSELKPSAYYMKEVDDINSTRVLRYLVMVTNDNSTPSEDDVINRHFRSIEYYNSYLSTHEPRAIDFFGRAMDFIMLRNYSAAIEDLDRALGLTPDFALAYFARGVARYHNLVAGPDSDLPDRRTATGTSPYGTRTVMGRPMALPSSADAASFNPSTAELRGIISDFDKAIDLSPRMAFAYYNKGNVLAAMHDFTSALLAYNKAIELKPDFGEAYYNRGYVYFQLGNREMGVENLSKAGELGVIPSYNLMKRMK